MIHIEARFWVAAVYIAVYVINYQYPQTPKFGQGPYVRQSRVNSCRKIKETAVFFTVLKVAKNISYHTDSILFC